jgi:hypothetical protein
MRTTVLILAAGDWSEWYWGPGNEELGKMIVPFPARHLLPIKGVPLILRTFEQIEDFGYRPVVVTQKHYVQMVSPRHLDPGVTRFWPETFLRTKNLWGDKTFVLQGDACWMDEGLEALFAGQDFPRVWAQGCGGVCAWAFLKEHHDQVIEAMETVIAAAEAGKNLGHPGDCYRALEGDQFRNYTPEEAQYWAQLPMGSYTDFDWPIHYLEFLEANPWARS